MNLDLTLTTLGSVLYVAGSVFYCYWSIRETRRLKQRTAELVATTDQLKVENEALIATTRAMRSAMVTPQ